MSAINPFILQMMFGKGSPTALGGSNPGTPPFFPGNPTSAPTPPANAPQNAGSGAPTGFFDKADQFLEKPGGNFLMNLLAQEGSSFTPTGGPLGAIGRAGLMTAQQGQEKQQSDLQRRLIESQIGKNNRQAQSGTDVFGKINPSDFTPASMAKFQRSNNFADLEIREDASSDPSAVREFEFFQGLPEAQQREFLRVKRSTPFKSVAGAGFGAPDPLTGEFEPSVSEDIIVAGSGERALAEGEGGRGRVRGPDGFEAVPGTQAARDEEAATRQRGKGALMTSIQAQTVAEDIDRLNKQIDDMPFGRNAAFQESLPPMLQSDEFRNANALIESVKGNVGVDSLLRIKQSGAGLGQVPQSQLDLLSRLLGELTLTQGKEQFVRTWNRMGDVYEQVWKSADAEMQEIGMPPPEVFKRIESGNSQNVAPEGTVITNQQGERMVKRNGQWVRE